MHIIYIISDMKNNVNRQRHKYRLHFQRNVSGLLEFFHLVHFPPELSRDLCFS